MFEFFFSYLTKSKIFAGAEDLFSTRSGLIDQLCKAVKEVALIVLILRCCGYIIFAMNNSLNSPEWYQGLEIKCIYTPEDGYYDGTLCSQETFKSRLHDIGLSEKEIIEVQGLPKPNYTRLQLNKDGGPLADLSKWFVVDEAEAGVLDNPTDQHVFATAYLMQCVAVAILAPQRTLFAHISIENTENGNAITNFFTLISPSQRETAKVFLVSSFYSEVFSRVYKVLRKCGYKTITADIESSITSFKDMGWAAYAYIKATDVETCLDFYDGVDPEILEHNVQKHFPIPGSRVLIINAKTGELYSITDRNQRALETKILRKWEKHFGLEFNFSDSRYDLAEFEDK